MKPFTWILVAGVLPILMSASSFATPPANALAHLHISPGFTRDPVLKELSILEDGIVTLKSTRLKTGEVTDTQLGVLSAITLASLKSGVVSIPPDGVILDGNPNGPYCADAPEYSYQVRPVVKFVEIARSAQCHQFMMNVGQAPAFKSILDGFNSLAEMNN